MRATGESAERETREKATDAAMRLAARAAEQGNGNAAAFILLVEWREAFAKDPRTRSCDGLEGGCWRPFGHTGRCVGGAALGPAYGLQSWHILDLIGQWGNQEARELPFCPVGVCLRPKHEGEVHQSAYGAFTVRNGRVAWRMA